MSSDLSPLAPDVDSELEDILRGMRASGQAAPPHTLDNLRRVWVRTVAEIEEGYDDYVEELANDVEYRAQIDEVLVHASPESATQLRAWLQPFDERFDAATVPASSPYHGQEDPTHRYAASRWHRRIPRVLVGQLKRDLEAVGIRPV